MSLRRLVCTVAAMGLIAAALTALTPAMADMAAALADAQRTVDTRGPDALVTSAAGLLAWVVWGWGALGLTLTAASALPGILGNAARFATRVLLPAGARRSAAVILGLGLGVAAPLVAATSGLVATPAVAASSAAGVPDWPTAPTPGAPPAPAPAEHVPAGGDPVPDWPTDPTATRDQDAHVVVRGDCLWRIAEKRLLAESGTPPTDVGIARAVHAWWTANADVIGPDPDRLLPGQVLRPPA
jgi:nucleoid-associated protein YgaU